MRVLVTGGGGFLGQALVRRLLSPAHRVFRLVFTSSYSVVHGGEALEGASAARMRSGVRSPATSWMTGNTQGIREQTP